MCSVYLDEEDRVVNVACEHLEPVKPSAEDKVSRIAKQNHCPKNSCQINLFVFLVFHSDFFRKFFSLLFLIILLSLLV